MLLPLICVLTCWALVQVSAVADAPRVECSAPAPAIAFKPTMMFQTRSFAFSLTNPALTTLSYRWQLLHTDGSPDTSSACCRDGSEHVASMHACSWWLWWSVPLASCLHTHPALHTTPPHPSPRPRRQQACTV